MRRWLLALVGVGLAAGPSWADDACCDPAQAGPASAIHTLAPVTLTDQRGAPVALPDGRPWVVTFFFGSCKSVCPTMLYNLGAIAEVMPAAARGKVGFAAVSFDPARDTVAKLAEYQVNFDLTGDAFHLVTGAPSDLRRVCDTFDFDFKPDRSGGFQHTTLIALLDGQGRVTQHFYGLAPDVERIAALATELVAK